MPKLKIRRAAKPVVRTIDIQDRDVVVVKVGNVEFELSSEPGLSVKSHLHYSTRELKVKLVSHRSIYSRQGSGETYLGGANN